ncbi:MAG: hypothetical protein HXX14_20475 [Bacteroidetes bacterium]|uniref:Anti-sigma-28 factor FlgM C-terminal domain-containing protein n=1 Tax=Candidatus Chlorohelix allophototropha TaxID=3003348 RepID=A0ABY9BBE2_9CHLR|nr:hypothetical protein [Bacteroidota bacterium]WJW70461.1 hypothetical protein OZ401_005098 [Chloroflexota bacterium L227-S17]
MANKRPPVIFNELEKPKGKNAILRSPAEIAADNELIDEGFETVQDFKNSINQENKISGNQENAARKAEQEKAAIRASYPKATYRLSPEAVEAIEDIKRIIRRKYKGKILLEEVVEEAVLAAYRDLTENGDSSFLVNKFSGNQENKIS